MTLEERREKRRIILQSWAALVSRGQNEDQDDIAVLDALDALDTPPLFQQVMQASADYVTRFGGEISLAGAMTKMHEEYAEFITAIDDYVQVSAARHHAGIESDLEIEAAKEAMDLLVTIGGVLAAANVRYQFVEQASRYTLNKLDTRTTDTHAWNPDTMTVERIGKVLK